LGKPKELAAFKNKSITASSHSPKLSIVERFLEESDENLTTFFIFQKSYICSSFFEQLERASLMI
jgi:hypothetical protein